MLQDRPRVSPRNTNRRTAGGGRRSPSTRRRPRPRRRPPAGRPTRPSPGQPAPPAAARATAAWPAPGNVNTVLGAVEAATHAGRHRLGRPARRVSLACSAGRPGGEHGRSSASSSCWRRRRPSARSGAPVPPRHPARDSSPSSPSLIETYNKGVAALAARPRCCSSAKLPSSGTWPRSSPPPKNRCRASPRPCSSSSGSAPSGSLRRAARSSPNLFPDRHGIAFLLAAVGIVTVAATTSPHC